MSPSKSLEEVRHVLSHYAFVADRIEPLGGAGGFSGAEFWRVYEQDSVWCLRCWPTPHPSRDRLQFIHGVLKSVARRGLEVVPVPLPTQKSETFVSSGRHLWELARWMPGSPASRTSLSTAQLTAAMRCLATFHVHAAEDQQSVGTAPGIVERSGRIRELQGGMLLRIQEACKLPPWPKLASRVDPIMFAFHEHAAGVLRELLRAEQLRAAVQPCIRDIWSDHVLFTEDEVTGLIDFGAMRLDHVTADIARLLGSLASDEKEARQAAIETYTRTRTLSNEEQLLLKTYDESSTLLSGMNWLQWICLERRQFPDHQRVLQRLDEIIQRLGSLRVA